MLKCQPSPRNLLGRPEDFKVRSFLKEDISKILVLLPEEWNRSKKQFVRLSLAGTTKEPIWLGRKTEFSANGNKSRVEYSDEDIAKIDEAPDDSVIQVRNNKGVFKFQKKNGTWEQNLEG